MLEQRHPPCGKICDKRELAAKRLDVPPDGIEAHRRQVAALHTRHAVLRYAHGLGELDLRHAAPAKEGLYHHGRLSLLHSLY